MPEKHHSYRVLPLPGRPSCPQRRYGVFMARRPTLNVRLTLPFISICFCQLRNFLEPFGYFYSPYLVLFPLARQTSGSEEPINSFGRSVRGELQATSGYDSLAVYVNYAHSDETLANRYGEKKLDRLVGLKKK